MESMKHVEWAMLRMYLIGKNVFSQLEGML